MHYWIAVIALCTTFSAFEIPLRLVFGAEEMATPNVVSITITMLFAADLVVRLRQSRRDMHGAGSRMDAQYPPYGPWRCLADVLAIVPARLLWPGTPLELLRLLKLPRITQYLWQVRNQQISNWNVLRLILFAYWLILVVHWLACGWILIQEADEKAMPTGDVVSTYIWATYWCVTTLATVGYGDIGPTTTIERVYAMAVMIGGVAMYSFVIGNVASILASMQPARRRYVEHMERITAFMRYRNINPQLQRRIREYYTFIWGKRLGYDESTLIADLPASLMNEVSLFLKRDIIDKVPFFQGVNEELLREIAAEMRPTVFTPGDYVCRAGEDGDEMFFINRGTLEVISADGRTVFVTLHDGDFFGEIAVLTNVKRTASVRAVEFCDLYALKKSAVEKIVARHPELAQHIDDVMRQRQARETTAPK